MSKQKNTKFIPEGEVTEFSVNAFGAEVEISGGDKFYAEFPDGSFTADEKKGKIYFRRVKKGLALSKTWIKIFVPDSCVPEVKCVFKRCALTINGGIYGELAIYAETSRITVKDAAFNIVFVKGNALNAEYASTTVKNALIFNVKSGDILGKESFFSRMDIDLKSGNVGLWETDFALSEVKVKSGNIQAMLSGTENDYKLALTAKNGTCNRENGGSGLKSLKFLAARGNIIVDFNKKQKENEKDADDDVAENISGESGT